MEIRKKSIPTRLAELKENTRALVNRTEAIIQDLIHIVVCIELIQEDLTKELGEDK